jgi:Uma2 family endonuclease
VQAVEHAASISVEDYLAGELKSDIRHEYIGGLIRPMAEISTVHNRVCQNLVIALHPYLRGTACQVFMGSLKLKLHIANEHIFYYPDLIVTCDPRDTDEYYISFPMVLIEVWSPETERIDRGEKFSSYTQIETLAEYILVAQDRTEVIVFRRANEWRPEVANQPQQQPRIESLDFTLPLEAIYLL